MKCKTQHAEPDRFAFRNPVHPENLVNPVKVLAFLVFGLSSVSLCL
jgi:hypothetical protein